MKESHNEALREALLNSIAHKDYSQGNPILISVYKNKIVFTNDAYIPDEWNMELLKKKHPSKPYNPLIANTLFRAGLIEIWGRGTLKIISDCLKNDFKEPVFKYELSSFILEIEKKIVINNKMSENMSEKIMILISERQDITIKIISDILKVSNRTVERYLKILQEEKKIKRVGSKRSGIWKIL